jgi:kinesin family protein 11
MKALDDFVTRARSQNAQHHDSHVASLQGLSTTVKVSYSNIGSHCTSTYERVRNLGDEMSSQTGSLQDSLAPLDTILRQPLAELRDNICKTVLQEYQPTGETPQKIQYQYPTELPRTEAHETLLAALRRPTSSSPSKQTTIIPVVFNDGPGDEVPFNPPASLLARPTGGLREIDVNISSAGLLNSDFHQHQALPSVPSSGKGVKLSTFGGEKENPSSQIPSFKRSTSGKLPLASQKSGGKRNTVAAVEDRENIQPAQSAFSQSVGGIGGRRRSPRTAGS